MIFFSYFHYLMMTILKQFYNQFLKEKFYISITQIILQMINLSQAEKQLPSALSPTSSGVRLALCLGDWGSLVGSSLLPFGQATVGNSWLSCHISQCLGPNTGSTIGYGEQQEGNTFQGLNLSCFTHLLLQYLLPPQIPPCYTLIWGFRKMPTDIQQSGFQQINFPRDQSAFSSLFIPYQSLS